jgi:DNA-binding transcriptional LysR family regulator
MVNRQELSQLELSAVIAFVEVAERGSFTEAAVRLNLSQPTVSQQVQRLERFVGAQLLHRRSNGVSLTDEGELFIKHCRASLQSLRSGVRAIAQFSQVITGNVTLGLVPSAAQRCLSDILPQYRQQHPDVTVKIIEDFPNELVDGLQRQLIDLAILSLPIPTEPFEVEVLYEEPLVLTAAATHPLASVGEVTWEILKHQAIVLPRQRTDFGVRYIIEELFRQHHSPMQTAAEVSGFQSLRQLILLNFGVTILPQSLVRKDIEEGKLIAKELPGLLLAHKVALVMHRQYQMSLAAEKMAEIIRVHSKKLSSSMT